MLTQHGQCGLPLPSTSGASDSSQAPDRSKHALIVEDDEVLCRFLGRLFEADGFHVEFAHTGDAALAKLAPKLDLVILDLNLPGPDGIEVLRQLRLYFEDLSVLVLTGRTRSECVVLALESGADDCLLKPFSHSELLARTRAVLRRKRDRPLSSARCGSLVLNLTEFSASRDGVRLNLTPREFRLLEFLMRSAGKPVSRSTLMAEVWGKTCESSPSNVVDVYMKYLRDKIELPGSPKLIHTIRGVGYIIREH